MCLFSLCNFFVLISIVSKAIDSDRVISKVSAFVTTIEKAKTELFFIYNGLHVISIVAVRCKHKRITNHYLNNNFNWFSFQIFTTTSLFEIYKHCWNVFEHIVLNLYNLEHKIYRRHDSPSLLSFIINCIRKLLYGKMKHTLKFVHLLLIFIKHSSINYLKILRILFAQNLLTHCIFFHLLSRLLSNEDTIPETPNET